MYIKIKKGTDTFNKLSELDSKINKARDKAKEVTKQLGAIKSYNTNWGPYLAGSIEALEFEEEPDTTKFRKVGKSWQRLWYPKSSNKAAFKLLHTLTPVKDNELNDIVGFGGLQMVGNAIYERVGVEFRKEYHLIEVGKGCKFNLNDDMEEITESEYLKLKGK